MRWPRRRPRRALDRLALALLLGCATPAAADLVLIPQADGTLAARGAVEGFSRHYVVGPHRPVGDVFLFPSDEADGNSEALSVDAPLNPSRASDAIAAEIDAVALRYAQHPGLRRAGLGAIDWALLLRANIEIESAYDPSAVSPVGAIGLGQLMPATATDLGVDPHDWSANLDGSARYLLAMLERFGSIELALAAYNAGPEAVQRHGAIPPFAETRTHVLRVLAAFTRLKGEF